MFSKSIQSLGAAALLGLVSGAQAQDIAPGTVINAANIDQVKAQTFQGKPWPT